MFFSPLEQFTIIKLIPMTISGGLDFISRNMLDDGANLWVLEEQFPELFKPNF